MQASVEVASAAQNFNSAPAALSQLQRPSGAEGDPASPVAPFSGVISEAVKNLDALEQQASSAVQGLVSGRGVDVHEAMIATQKSDQAFELALAVRGKLVSAYQAVMGTQF